VLIGAPPRHWGGGDTFSDDGTAFRRKFSVTSSIVFHHQNARRASTGLGLNIVYNLVTQQLGERSRCLRTKKGPTFCMALHGCRSRPAQSVTNRRPCSVGI